MVVRQPQELGCGPSYYYRPQRSFGQGYVSLVCVILFSGGGRLPQCMLGYHPWDHAPYPPTPPHPPDHAPPPTQTMRTHPRTMHHSPGPCTPPGPCDPHTGPCTPPGTMHTPPPSGIRSMSGRYASYWNAFLFGKNFTEHRTK